MSQEHEKPKLILIADSEGQTMPIQRLRDLLEHDGFLVHLETDGFRALMWMENNVPDFMLVDMSLTRLNGSDFIKVIRYLARTYHEYRKIVIAATSTSHDSKSFADAVNAGAKFLFSKPWQVSDLIAKIKKSLNVH